jgi:hypothetical protein
VPTRELARQVALPLLAAAVTGAVAFSAAALVPSDLVALVVAGIVATAAIALVVLRKWTTVREHLSASREPAPAATETNAPARALPVVAA